MMSQSLSELGEISKSLAGRLINGGVKPVQRSMRAAPAYGPMGLAHSSTKKVTPGLKGRLKGERTKTVQTTMVDSGRPWRTGTDVHETTTVGRGKRTRVVSSQSRLRDASGDFYDPTKNPWG